VSEVTLQTLGNTPAYRTARVSTVGPTRRGWMQRAPLWCVPALDQPLELNERCSMQPLWRVPALACQRLRKGVRIACSPPVSSSPETLSVPSSRPAASLSASFSDGNPDKRFCSWDETGRGGAARTNSMW